MHLMLSMILISDPQNLSSFWGMLVARNTPVGPPHERRAKYHTVGPPDEGHANKVPLSSLAQD